MIHLFLSRLIIQTSLPYLHDYFAHGQVALTQGDELQLSRTNHQISFHCQQPSQIIIRRLGRVVLLLFTLRVELGLYLSLTASHSNLHLIISASLLKRSERLRRTYKASFPTYNSLVMKITKYLTLDQNSEQMEELAKKNGTTLGICGFVTCAIAEYLASLPTFSQDVLPKLNAKTLTPLIDKVMKTILARRRMELKKFYKIMSDNDRKNYLKDWVASYQIADYLESKAEDFVNPQVYFFRQCAYDHPAQLNQVKLQQKERVTEEERFKGQRFFFSSFNPYCNWEKQEFEGVLRNADPTRPVIISTDVFQHFYTVVLWEGQIYILDSLSSFMEVRHDSQIVECIEYLYKQSYLIKEKGES